MVILDVSVFDVETVCRAVGLVGFALYVGAFFALSVGKLDSRQPRYFAIVLTASSCVLVSLWADFNLSSALIQSFYILMSFGAIILRKRTPQNNVATVQI